MPVAPNEDDEGRARHPSAPVTTTHDISFSGTGQMIYYHLAAVCAGTPCPFHHPSDHHMVGWAMHLRTDLWVPLVVRICHHGCGHPDPDSAAYLAPRYGDWVWTHDCDGCCGAEDAGPMER